MNRDALLVYLRDLRDLEIAKRRTQELIGQANQNANHFHQEARTTHYEQKRRFPWREMLGDIMISLVAACMYFVFYDFCESEEALGWGYFVIFIFALVCLFFIEAACGAIAHSSDESDCYIHVIVLFLCLIAIKFFHITSTAILAVGGIALTTTAVLFPIIRVIKYFSDNAKIDTYNKEEKERAFNNYRTNTATEHQWLSQSGQLSNDLAQINRLLSKGYGLNILASQYRNLQSVYYIYDYMSTSRASLEDTLIHEHMENGIQRILDRLDTIISQNERIIFQNRQLEAQNRQISNSTRNMLSSLSSIEASSQEAAEYAAISANYAEATAFFAAANYLRR